MYTMYSILVVHRWLNSCDCFSLERLINWPTSNKLTSYGGSTRRCLAHAGADRRPSPPGAVVSGRGTARQCGPKWQQAEARFTRREMEGSLIRISLRGAVEAVRSITEQTMQSWERDGRYLSDGRWQSVSWDDWKTRAVLAGLRGMGYIRTVPYTVRTRCT